VRLVSVAEMRELEARTFASGVLESMLQARAGRTVADFIATRHPTGGTAVAFVGSGNNGRDAWIAVTELINTGLWTGALYVTPRHAVTGPELEAFMAAGGRVVWHSEAQVELAVRSVLVGATVAVDGLLGIGGRGAPRPPLDRIIAALNRERAERPELSVVSVDVPSGLDADSGAAEGAVVADATVVLGGMKQGLLAPAALDFTGELVLGDIGVVEGPDAAPHMVTPGAVKGLLPRPRPSAHKGSNGRLLVVAGSARYIGAAFLVSAAAVRAGAGIVALAAPPTLRDVVASRLAEATYIPLPDGGPAVDPRECAERIRQELGAFSALAIGPGLSTAEGVGDFVEAVLRERARIGIPTVVDADALNVLAQRPGWEGWIGENIIMTPHLGELRRLTSVDDGEAPWATAGRLAQRWGVTLVVKGPCTAIGSADRVDVHARPNPALASGGTGDVLTGITGGLLARGVPPAEAARLAVWVHGETGAAAARGKLAGGLMASDLLDEIPGALAQVI
jgi:ADP-dependent NAD(P)H-hydrate dehydratase / NAD(P)H-hydrate epimerase